MEASGSSDMLVLIYQTTQGHIQEDIKHWVHVSFFLHLLQTDNITALSFTLLYVLNLDLINLT
jgi:hypothetical protein